MADNVAIKDASNASVSIATNDLGGGLQAQTIQLLASDAATADDRIPASETDGLLVDLGANNDVQGAAAADAAVAGNPLYTGGRASTATPTAVSADGDAVGVWTDRNGAVMTHPRPAGTATLANVAGSASSVTLQAANTGRLGLVVVNDSTATLYLKYGSAATTSSYTYRLDPGAQWEMPDGAFYTGIVTGIWSSAAGNARVTELTS